MKGWSSLKSDLSISSFSCSFPSIHRYVLSRWREATKWSSPGFKVTRKLVKLTNKHKMLAPKNKKRGMKQQWLPRACRVKVRLSNVGVFISDCTDSTACYIMPNRPFIIDSFPLGKCYFLQKAFLKILIHPCFCEDWAEWRHRDRSPPAPRFTLLGYVWEVEQQMAFRCNVIIIDLPLVKEADR